MQYKINNNKKSSPNRLRLGLLAKGDIYVR